MNLAPFSVPLQQNQQILNSCLLTYSIPPISPSSSLLHWASCWGESKLKDYLWTFPQSFSLLFSLDTSV